jgi:hypothetical protein
MATAGLDRALTVIPDLPPIAQSAWERRVAEVGVETVQRGIDSRNVNPHPLDKHSFFERRMQDGLEYCGIDFHKNPFALPLFDQDSNRFYTYKPDFELPNIRINGRPVLLEVKSAVYLEAKDVKKFELVQQTYGFFYWVVMVVNTYPALMDRKLEEAGNRHAKIAQEIWFLADDPPDDGKYHNRHINMRGASSEVRALIRANLDRLRIRDSGPMPLIAPQG